MKINDQISIQFKDTEDWQTVSGEVISWFDYSERNAPVRISSVWQKPRPILTLWNGIQRTVRHSMYNTYKIDFFIRESEIEILQRIQSATIITISDLRTGKIYGVDLSEPELLEVSEPAKVANTYNYAITITFRTNRVNVDYALRSNDEYSLILNNEDQNGDFVPVGSLSAPTYIDLYFNPLYTQNDAEINATNNGKGIDSPTKIVNKQTINLLIFKDLFSANFLKKHLPNCNKVYINRNTVNGFGTGTVSSGLIPGSGTMSVPEAGVNEITFSTPQTFGIGAKIYFESQAAVITGITSNVAFQIDSTFVDVYTNVAFEFEYKATPYILFSTAQTATYGQFIVIGTENKRITSKISSTLFSIESDFSEPVLSLQFSLTEITNFLESGIVQIQTVDEDLCQINVNGTVDVLIVNPQNI